MPLPNKTIYTEEDYYQSPEDFRNELINGQFFSQAAPSRVHQELLSFLHLEIAGYIRDHDGFCKIYPAPFAVQLSTDFQELHSSTVHNEALYPMGPTVVEPDLSVICDPRKLTGRGCLGAPDWIIEIVSPSSKRMDYYTKLSLYRTAGVREYWIVDPMKQLIIVYDMIHDDGPVLHAFTDTVKAGIYDDLKIDFSKY